MRKIGILSLLTMILTLTLLLTSCGGSLDVFSSFDKVLNPDYDVTETIWATGNAIPELEGYVLQDQTGDIAIFSKLNETTGVITYKVFNLNRGSVILTLGAENTVYEFNLNYENLGVILVEENYFYDTVSAEPRPSFAHVAYDKAGNRLSKREDQSPRYPFALGEMVVYDDVAYGVDKATGALIKEMDVPEYMAINAASEQIRWNDDYYYVLTNEQVFVYDLSLQYVSSWTVPDFATVQSKGVLNNGDILVQYSYILDEDAKEYDFYESIYGTSSVKYDLITLLINPKNGNAKEIDMKYIVNELVSCREVYDAEDENNYYNDSFDNIAYVSPIVNQQIDSSEAAQDVVLLSDNGKIKKSLKLVDGQTAMLPQKIGDGVYAVLLVNDGAALVDIDGNVLARLNNTDFLADVGVVGQYLVSEKAVYNFDMDVVYSFAENNAKYLGFVQDTVFVREGTDAAYTVYAFRNGDKRLVYTYDESAENSDSFSIVEDIGYVIENAMGEYVYYNVKGDLLLTTTTALQWVCSSENSALYMEQVAIENLLNPAYYVFKK